MFAIDSGGNHYRQAEILVVLRHADIAQILGHAIARNRGIQIGRTRQIAAAFVIQSAIAGERARDLANPVRTEVEADASVFISNGRQRLAVAVSADKGNHEFVGHSLVVGIFHSLHRVGALAAFRVGENHRVVGLGNALPTPVAIHGVVASVHRCDLAAVVFAHLLLQFFQISGAVGGQSIASVHEGVNEHAVHSVLLGHLQQRVKMSLLRVHAPVRNEAEQMKPPFSRARMFHCIQQHRMRKEFAILDHQINARNVHVDNASGTNIEMTDLAVAHLPFGQPNKWPAGMNQRVRILPQQAVVGRFAGESDGVGFRFGSVSPAVENCKNERFRTRHKSASSSSRELKMVQRQGRLLTGRIFPQPISRRCPNSEQL